MPISFTNFFKYLLITVIVYSFFSIDNGIEDASFLSGLEWFTKLLRNIKEVRINLDQNIVLRLSILITIWFRILYRNRQYFC